MTAEKKQGSPPCGLYFRIGADPDMQATIAALRQAGLVINRSSYERNMHAIPLTSAHAVSIPGAVDAWATILRDHGKLGLDTLLQPAIKAAEEGYVVAPRIAFDWKNGFEKLKKGTNSERYLLPHGKPAVAGDVIKQPELGQTLRAIAKNGRDAFYKGAIAEDMVETLRGIGGLHTTDDFARHTTETTVPIGTMYKGLDVWQCPPNGPGITMLVMLNILARFDLTKFPPLSVERFHLEAEAARVAYMMREQYIGDPGHVDVDVVRILSKEFADEHGDSIRMDRLLDLPDVAPPMERPLESEPHFWQTYLAGLENTTGFITDRLKPAVPSVSRPYAEYRCALEMEATSQLHGLARANGMGLATLLIAAWAILLSRYSGRKDVVFGFTLSRSRNSATPSS